MSQDAPPERYAFRTRRDSAQTGPRDPALEERRQDRSGAAPAGEPQANGSAYLLRPQDGVTSGAQHPSEDPVPAGAAAPGLALDRGAGIRHGMADRPPARGRAGGTGDDDDLPNIDIRGILLKLWRGKWIILVSVVIAALLAFVPISRMQPVYRAGAKVMFNLDRSGIVDIGQMVLGSTGETTLQNQVEILQSTRLIEGVVDKLALDQDPEFNPFLARRLAMQGSTPAEPATAQEREFERRIIVELVTARLELTPITGTRVIEIEFVAGNPQTAAAIVNAVAEQYILDQLDAKLEATRAATAWLTDRVEELRDKLQTAEEAVETARAAQSQEAGQGLEITQQQLVAANASLNGSRNETAAARSAVDRISTALREGRDFGSVPDFRSSQIIAAYRAELAVLSSQAKQFGAASIRLAEIESRMAEVRQLMAAEAAQILQAAETDLASKEEREAALVADIRALEDKALAQSRAQVEIRQLEREAEASRVLYENFLSRLEQANAQQDLESADARILSAAEPPLRPLAEASRRTMTIALGLGALIGIAIVFLIDKLNNTFRSPAQIEGLTGETVIGTVPAVGKRLHKREVFRHFAEKPKSSLAESVRSLRTSILFSDIDSPPQVVMFTSSVPGEAKSTTSVLVAITSHQMGRSSIIVDCDLRLPTLSQLFENHDDHPGLLAVIEGTATLDEAIFRDPVTGLHVLMTRPSEPTSTLNAADVLASKRFRDLIAVLRTRYDLVILDAPPTLVVADSRILAPLVDAVVYLVRWNRTPRDAVEEGLKELRLVSAPLAGVAMTMIDEQRASSYAYEGYGYHKGRYRDYFDAEEAAPGPIGWATVRLRALARHVRHRIGRA